MTTKTADDKRLIEVAFPLKQTSIDSVHEKNVRHGHISTLHVWPARRPLAASRAALIATLLPDPGDKVTRDDLLKRVGGTLQKTIKKKKLPSGRVEDIESWETDGGILRWGRESGEELEWFRDEIRKAYGGRAPKVLDPFAGGGAIPLEAMRLGCEVTAVDINPVAWFILKCTLEYPHKLSGQKRRLPDFVLNDAEFMTAYFKARGMNTASIKHMLRMMAANGSGRSGKREDKKQSGRASAEAPRGHTVEMFATESLDETVLDSDLAWHVRAWGLWVLNHARQRLAPYYPTYAEFCSVKPYGRVPLVRADEEQLRLVPVNDTGVPQVDLLNAGLSAEYLENPKNPRWIAKPTVAYLWARTAKCKACRATIPLLKTRWLCRKDNKRVILTMIPASDKTNVVFGLDPDVPMQGGNAAQKREYDKRIGSGTMSRAGAQCPHCGTIMTMEDLRLEGRARRLTSVMTAVVVDSPSGKEYRLPTSGEREAAANAERDLDVAYSDIPFGVPSERMPSEETLGFRVQRYGFDTWGSIHSARQLMAFSGFIRSLRAASQRIAATGYGQEWSEALTCYLVCGFDRMLDFNSALLAWITSVEAIAHTFVRYALPMNWDYSESATVNYVRGGWRMSLDAVCESLETIGRAANAAAPTPRVMNQSAVAVMDPGTFDIIVTDPPYYDAIPYSDLMDYFYVWLRRTLNGVAPEFDSAFSAALSPKWIHETNDGELIDDASRFGGDREKSRQNYEEGMARAFAACHDALTPSGRFVIVFAHKHPNAWETLVAAIIKAGFVVDGSWPIQTEQAARMRAQSSAALSSSVWLVCRKRDPLAKAGWDEKVLGEMHANITQRLRDFWDAGIRGPDFVWSATGPALEAYSRYPVVKKASEPGQLMSVSEFLGHVRRMVVDFVVGRVLTRGEMATPDEHPLDDVTTYYLLHRNDFGLKEAPAGACILYAVSCDLSESELADQYSLLSRGGAAAVADEDAEEGEDADASESSGGQFKLRAWNARRHRSLGAESSRGRPPPLIDQIHMLMQLWQAGDVNKVNDYLDARGQRKNPLFAQVIQALIEKSRDEKQQEECSLLERLANHVRGLGTTPQGRLALPQ